MSKFERKFGKYAIKNLSLTLIITGYVCISVGIEQTNTNVERGVAGIMAIVLAIHGATYGLITGIVLYFLMEKTSFFKQKEEEREFKKAG